MIADKPEELALRRPDFEPGVPIVLSDGQEWHFRRPVMADYYPAVAADGRLILAPGFDLGPAYDALVDAYIGAESVAEEHLALVALAHELLRRNYAIDAKQLRFIFRLKRPGDPEVDANQEMWAEVAAVVLGRDSGPKPMPVGSEPS